MHSVGKKIKWSDLFSYLALIALLLLAWHMRIGVINETVVLDPLRTDAGKYYSYAQNMNEYGVFSDRDWNNAEGVPKPDARLAPLFPWVISHFSTAKPDADVLRPIQIWNVIASVLTVLLVFFCARQAIGTFFALLAAAMTAISPQMVNSTVYILTEPIFTFLLWLGISLMVLAVSSQKSRAHWLWGLAGILIGLSALTRPTTQYLVFFLAFGLFLLDRQKFQRAAVLLVCGFMLVYLPWMWRNFISTGAISDSTAFLNTLIHGHYPNLMFNGDVATLGAPYRADPELRFMSASLANAFDVIWERVLEQPLLYMRWYTGGKIFAFFDWNDYSASRGFFTYPVLMSPFFMRAEYLYSLTLMHALHGVMVIFAMLGVVSFFLRKNWVGGNEVKAASTKLIFAIVVIYFVAVHVVGFSISRYSMPILPLIYILALGFLGGVIELFVQFFRKARPYS